MSMIPPVSDPFALNPFGGVIPPDADTTMLGTGVAGPSTFHAPGVPLVPLGVGVGVDADVNSPATFASNVQIAHNEALRIQQLALSVINGIEHAYEPTVNPMQTAADLAALKQALQSFNAFLVQTGVGGLPHKSGVPMADDAPLTEQTLNDRHESVMRTLYTRTMNPKELSTMVADVLQAPDRKTA